MPLTIILTGIPGSGKSTVLQETLHLVPELKVINYGEMMLREASLRHIDKDTLRKLPLADQQKIGIKAAQKMAKELSGIICIDTHATIKTPLGYCPGIPETVLRILRPQAIGMIECSAALIHQRRQRNGSRNRDKESIEEIEYHQQISRAFLLACSAISGALYVPVHNQGEPSAAARELARLIHSLPR